MKLRLHGGVGEKGRTCIGIEAGGARILLDVGVNTSVPRGPAYYPAISTDQLAAIDAIVVTHAHEDHVAALGWCVANGFNGRVFMTAETRADIDATLADYATPDEQRRAGNARVEIIQPSEAFAIGPCHLQTGRSGHVVGGVWVHVSANGRSVGYCGDVVPASPVLAMDAAPPCDLILFDASYGDDNVAAAVRGDAVKSWIAAHPGGGVLPTPLSGRSLELMALIDAPLAIHRTMQEPLARQIAARAWLVPGAADLLSRKLETALLWDESLPLPRAALLCHDGMGMAGPSRAALERAARERHPVLLTGHVPTGSPGAHLQDTGEADWLRLPTHPTLDENIALVQASGATRVFAHSCDAETLPSLALTLPSLAVDARTGDVISV